MTLDGPSAPAIAIESDSCSGQPLAAGGSCRVWVRPENSIAGPISATVELTDQGGSEYDVSLAGYTAATKTELQVVSDPLDRAGLGNVYLFTPETQIIRAVGDPSRIYVQDRRHDLFVPFLSASFAVPDGEILAPGHYAGATRYPGDGTTPTMAVNAAYACQALTGEFAVHEVAFDAFGRVRPST